eukprot:8471426-Lingulodinium_polyedra.AAC.1
MKTTPLPERDAKEHKASTLRLCDASVTPRLASQPRASDQLPSTACPARNETGDGELGPAIRQPKAN